MASTYPKVDTEIRPLAYADLSAAMAIERVSFEAPWSLAMFVSELSRPDSICLAAEYRSRLVGYLICTPYDRVYHLNNVAVASNRRRQGIATGLIEELLGELGEGSEVTLEVRPSNAAAISVYERFGFCRAGRRRRYYPDNREDALIMTRPAAVEGLVGAAAVPAGVAAEPGAGARA